MTTDQPFFWYWFKINIFNKLASFAIIIIPSNDNAVLALFTSFKGALLFAPFDLDQTVARIFDQSSEPSFGPSFVSTFISTWSVYQL